MKQEIATSVAYICAASSTICFTFVVLMSSPGVYYTTQLSLIAISSAFLVASVLVFRWARIGYSLGLISGLGALYWFYGVEFGYPFPALNTWVVFNLPDAAEDASRHILLAKLKIAFAITALAAAVISATRLLPADWVIRKRPVRDRLWPALAVCVLAALFWYAVSVSPYRIPWIVDAVPPKLSLLHVQKHGSQFHETGISVFGDGRVFSWHNDRRLFQYRFQVHTGSAVLASDNTTRRTAFALAEELSNADTAPAVLLHSKNAEGWYVRTGYKHVLAFTTEDGTPPPQQLLSLFRSLEAAVPATEQSGDEKDICFGFCYDPFAGLGIVYLNERCADRNGTRCK